MPTILMRLSPSLRSALAATTEGTQAVVMMPSMSLACAGEIGVDLFFGRLGRVDVGDDLHDANRAVVSLAACSTASMRSWVLGSTRKPVKWAMRPLPPIALISSLVPR